MERMDETRRRVQGLELFRHLKPETFDLLWEAGQVRRYKRGVVLQRAKERTSQVFVQLTGKTIVYNLTHAGKRKIIFVFGAGTLINEHVFDYHLSSTFYETIEDSKYFVVPISVFVECMKQDFELVKAVMGVQEWKLWRTTHQLKNTMGSIYMERKLASKLWKLARDFGVKCENGIEIDINMTITFLADMMGAPRETTSRLCKVLVEHELISIDKKRIVILDLDRMAYFYRTGEYDYTE